MPTRVQRFRIAAPALARPGPPSTRWRGDARRIDLRGQEFLRVAFQGLLDWTLLWIRQWIREPSEVVDAQTCVRSEDTVSHALSMLWPVGCCARRFATVSSLAAFGRYIELARSDGAQLVS